MPRIAELIAPIRLAESLPPPSEEDVRFHAWLATRNPELAEWNEVFGKTAVRAGYRNALFAATSPTLAEVLAVEDDGCRAARIRSVFCGVSAILEDAEELWLASWAPTSEGTSVVFGSHQDERELWPVAPSLADFLLLQYREDSYFQKDLEVPESIASLPVRMDGAPLPAMFDLMELTKRAHWIVALLFPEGDWYGLGNGLITAPSYDRFLEEEASLDEAPHLIAYWLLYHLVFDNRTALERLRPRGAASPYPPARELAAFASDPNQRPSWWDERAVLRLRAEAERGRLDLLEPEAQQTTQASRNEREALRRRILERLDPLPPTAAKMLTRAIIQEATLGEIEVEVIKDLGPTPEEDPDAAERDLEVRLLAKRGDAPGLGVLFEQVVSDVDRSWKDIATDLVALCKTESSVDLNAVALLMLASAAKWAAVVTHASSFQATDRLGRLAQAAVASKLDGDEPLAFLRSEATRFFGSLHERATDTAALAAVVLLRRHDDPTIAALTETLRANEPHGGAGRALIELMGPDPAFAAPLEVLVDLDFGRAAAGEPVLHAAMLAKAAAERARKLDYEAADRPERRAALLGGAIVAEPGNERLTGAANELLSSLDPQQERQAGAALALLRVVHEAGALGFADAAARWRSAKRSKYVGATLARWFDLHAGEIR